MINKLLISKSWRGDLTKWLITFLVLLMIGCATTTLQSLDAGDRSRVFNAEYSKVFKALIDFCTEKGFAVLTVDKEFGLINTDYKGTDPTRTAISGNARMKMNFSVEKVHETQTKVIATLSMEREGAFGTWKQMGSTEREVRDSYKSLFDTIQSRLEK